MSGRPDRAGGPWWAQALEALAAEPVAAAVVVAAALPLAVGAAIIAFARRCRRRQEPRRGL
jgi:hypothetical protein